MSVKKKKYKVNILAIAFISFFTLFFLRIAIGNFLLEKIGVCTKSVLIKELEKVKYHRPTLVYNFWLDGKKYDGNSNIEELNKVGDSICVVYLKSFPSVNRPTSYFEDKGNCNCK